MPRAYNVSTSHSPDAADSSPTSYTVQAGKSSHSSIPNSHVVFTNPGFQEEGKADTSQAQINNDSSESKETQASFDSKEVQTNSSLPSWCVIFAWRKPLKDMLQRHRQVLTRCVRVVLVLLYLAYTGYALYRQWGTESATRLWLVLAIVLWLCGGGHVFRLIVNRLGQVHVHPAMSARLRKVIRWCLYLAAVAGAVTYLALDIAPHHASNLIPLAGIAVLLLVALFLSPHPERVNWHTVFWALSLQFYLALFIMRTRAGDSMFGWLGDRIQEFIAHTNEGSIFLFGNAYTMHPFVFQNMPVTIFMNSVIAISYHIGAVQAIIASFGRFLAWCLDTTPVESVNAAANVFLGMPEASLVIKPFLDNVTESELFAIMTGGFASIAGGLMATIINIGCVLAYLFYPLMYLSGVDTPDLLNMGRLFGVKTLAGALTGYIEAAAVIRNSRTFNNYTTLTNGTWHHDGFDVVLGDWNQTLVGGVLTERSIVISTYILCGFSNLTSSGMCIGIMSTLAPRRIQTVLKHVMWACVAGNIACFLTGCVAALLYV